MTRDEIIEMASDIWPIDKEMTGVDSLVKFAQLVAAAEREACAKDCEPHDLWGPVAAKVIRARGNL